LKSVEQLLSLLGIARRAGKLSFGFDSVKDSLQSGRAALVLTAKDLSGGSREEIGLAAGRRGVPVAQIDAGMDALMQAVGAKRKIGIISVDDAGLAKRAKEIIDMAHGAEQ